MRDDDWCTESGTPMDEDQITTPQAWASFYVANRQVLATYALALTGDEHAAEDLIQDVLVRIVQRRRPARKGRAYVLRCMRNLLIDMALVKSLNGGSASCP